MMRRSVYRELTTCLLADCRAAIDEFSMGPHNKQVFAFALECDALHGGLMIGINTEAGLQRILSSRYPAAKPDEIEGIDGIRFRCREFAFNDFRVSSASRDLLEDVFTVLNCARTEKTTVRHVESLQDALIRVVLMLERDLSSLDASDLFVAFATRTGLDEAARVRMMRSTIPKPVFDRVFPELSGFEERIRSVRTLPPADRAAFWVTAARDLALDGQSADAARYRSNRMTLDSVVDSVVQIGSAAVPLLLDVLEQIAGQPQWIEDDASRQRIPSPSCDLSMRVMGALRAIRLVDEPSVDRVRALQHALANDATNQGPLETELAKLLHSLRPSLYPPMGPTPGRATGADAHAMNAVS